MEGTTYSNFEMKFKWSFRFLFLGYCDGIIDSIMEHYTKNIAELLEKSTSLKTDAPPPLSASYEQVDLQEAITAYRSRFKKNTLVH